LIIAGGCYLEVCTVPRWRRLFGSGGRAAAAVGRLSPGTQLHTYAHRTWVPDIVSSLHAFGVTASVRPIDQRISFSYFHPLSPALLEPAEPTPQAALSVSGDVVLRFGFVEGDAVVEARRAVHDPQTGQAAQAFRANGSRAETLAIVLNQGEAEVATGAAGDDVGAALLASHDAEVVVVKRGCEGARVFRAQSAPSDIPAYRSERVFKIGSGDVFSAAFAHHWGERGLEPSVAADLASRHVAHFVDYHALPLPTPAELGAQTPLPAGRRPGLIYLAGPFFDLAQRWLVEEALERLQALGAPVFSPLHEVGMGRPAEETAAADLEGLDRCAAVLALLDGADPGTLFEVGYARAHGKPVVVLAERVEDLHLTMLTGSGCAVVRDLTSALYRTVWAAME
jgi:hypothetical protein